MTQPDDAYYWAGGRRIELERDRHDVALDLERARSQGVSNDVLAEAERLGVALNDRLVLVSDSQLHQLGITDEAHDDALQPVFRAADGTRIVVLPEVRVEVADPGEQERLEAYVVQPGLDAKVTSSRPGRVVVTPSSGRGTDALDIANTMFERFHPEVSQARFLRIVPK